MRPKDKPLPGRSVPAILVLGAVALLLARLPALPHRRFDPDEFEHAHAAWCLFRGMLPYQDFFEHHTPWYYYALRPLFHWFTVEASFDGGSHFLLATRVLSLLLTAASLAVVIAIGRRWMRGAGNGALIGPLAALLLVSQPIFLQKTIEARPDVPALLLFVGALSLLVRGLTDARQSGAVRWWWFVGAGLCQGGAVMCTQKMLFVLPGLCGGLALWALFGGDRRQGPRRRTARVLAVVAFGVALAIPGVLTWALFAARGAGAAFITNNFLLNARWRPMATHQGWKFLLSSGPALALALVGAAAALWRRDRSQPRDEVGLVLLGTVASLFAGVLIMPVAQRQYYLMPLPIVCLFAARGLLVLLGWVRERARQKMAAVGLAIGLAILPLLALRGVFRDSNDAQRARLGEVYQRTAPTDLVMDGWEGTGVFRPHAFYYFFLHEEAVAMLPPRELAAYLDQLESGAIRPRLIAMDKNLVSLGPRFVAFVRRHYASGDGFFYYRQSP
jgi:uncharacterized membrane protein